MDVSSVVLVAAYALAVLLLSRRPQRGGATDYLLAGRRLSLPAFVATLVTTWYGGILGVGEYAWSWGLSMWVVFGVPYYLAAILFAFVLAPRLRETGAITIPDLLRSAYGRGAALAGAAGVLLQTVPIAYAVMLAALLAGITGWSTTTTLIVGVAFSAVYVSLSGFSAVVRSDALQLVLMYGGFLILLPVAVAAAGGPAQLWQALPESHRSWDGGLGWQAILVWYLIALQTMVEPSFYQRVFAARTPATARRGVLASVAMWMVFDFLTTFSGLAARVLLPDLADPVDAYPALARLVLSPWLAAIFTVGLFATVMSTLDSYLFIAATTVGHDLRPEPGKPEVERRRTRWGLLLAAAATVGGASLFDSAVEVWHHVGSVVTAALLLPVVSVHLPPGWRFSPTGAVTAILAGGGTALGWILAATEQGYPLGVEPLFPAFAVSFSLWSFELIRPGRE